MKNTDPENRFSEEERARYSLRSSQATLLGVRTVDIELDKDFRPVKKRGSILFATEAVRTGVPHKEEKGSEDA